MVSHIFHSVDINFGWPFLSIDPLRFTDSFVSVAKRIGIMRAFSARPEIRENGTLSH